MKPIVSLLLICVLLFASCGTPASPEMTAPTLPSLNTEPFIPATQPVETEPVVEETPAPIIKMAAYCRHSSYELEKELGQRWRKRMNVAVAGERWLDFTLTDKGEGLKRLCALLGVDLRDTVAVGDSFNDCPMLDAAGKSYVMSTADPTLLQTYPLHCTRVAELLDSL